MSALGRRSGWRPWLGNGQGLWGGGKRPQGCFGLAGRAPFQQPGGTASAIQNKNDKGCNPPWLVDVNTLYLYILFV